MRRGLMWLFGTATAMAIGAGLVACAGPVPLDEPTGNLQEGKGEQAGSTNAGGGTNAEPQKTKGVSINLSEDSILRFDGDPASAQLVDDMRSGILPTSCTVRYDQMGALPTVTTTDARTIREVYKRLARMHVEGTSNMSVTDSYHLVSFLLQDGTTASYSFEGASTLVRASQNYAVTDRGDLWSYVRQLQDEQIRDESAGDNWHVIELDDGQELVTRCPHSAPAGEVIQVEVPIVADANLHVSVNGDEAYGAFSSEDTYEFTMPDSPVVVRVWTSADGLPGA